MIKLKILPISKLIKIKEFDGHQAVYSISEPKSGLVSFVSIHNSNGGHAIGGTRYFAYKNEDEALRDALNLSRSMSYKCAIAGIKMGGGKAVIMAPEKGKNPALIDAYARAVNSLNGLFRTGEDVGIDEADVIRMGTSSKFILGLPGNAGDPSPWAALSVFRAIEAALNHSFGGDAMNGRTFAIKGVGKVGAELLRLIYECGGEVTVADVDKERVADLQKKFPGVRVVTPDEINKIPVDVYAPCAMGGEFTPLNVAELNCKIICGSANNQLADRTVGRILYDRGIIYVPDYLANAGGLINVADELNSGGYNRERVRKNVLGIRDIASKVIDHAVKESRPTNEISDKFAEDFLHAKM